jgi:hypothetical protein
MLMAAEAMPMVANMIENDSKDNFDEIMLSLDWFNALFHYEWFFKIDLSIKLIKLGILNRLFDVLDVLLTLDQPPYSKLFGKSLDLIHFITMQESQFIRDTVSELKFVPAILPYLTRCSELSNKHISQILKIVHNVYDKNTKSEEAAVIKSLIYVYSFQLKQIKSKHEYISQGINSEEFAKMTAVNEKLMYDILRQLLHYWQYSQSAREIAAKNGFIQWGIHTASLGNINLKLMVLDMMIGFINTSSVIRDEMWGVVKGPHLLITFLDKNIQTINVKVFDALVWWLKLDKVKIEEYLWEDKNLLQIFKWIFSSSKNWSIQDYLHVLNWIKEIINFSTDLARFISDKAELVSWIAKQIEKLISSGQLSSEMSANQADANKSSHFYSNSSSHPNGQNKNYNISSDFNLVQVLKDLLEILLLLKSKVNHNKFVKIYKLKPLFIEILQFSESENLNIHLDICEKLLSDK